MMEAKALPKTQAPKKTFSFDSVRLAALGILIIALWGMIYLGIISQSALTGQRVHALQEKLDRINRENAQLEYEIGVLTTPAKMAERAAQLGLRPATPAQTVYLVLRDYPLDSGKQNAALREPPVNPVPPRPFSLAAWWSSVLARLGLAPSSGAADAKSP